jgi:hypothetical protein
LEDRIGKIYTINQRKVDKSLAYEARIHPALAMLETWPRVRLVAIKI